MWCCWPKPDWPEPKLDCNKSQPDNLPGTTWGKLWEWEYSHQWTEVREIRGIQHIRRSGMCLARSPVRFSACNSRQWVSSDWVGHRLAKAATRWGAVRQEHTLQKPLYHLPVTCS